MPAAVVLQRDEREVQVWLSKEKRVESIDLCDCPATATPGTPLELKMDARCRVLECRETDRPLKMQSLEGMTRFLDVFIFPMPNFGFSLYFGAVGIEPGFAFVDPLASYLAYVTWDIRRSEMIIQRQSTLRVASLSEEETRQLRDAYGEYLDQGSATVRYKEPPKWEQPAVVARRGEVKGDEGISIHDRVKQFSHGINSTSVREGSGQRREEERPVSDQYMMYPLMMRPNSRESRAPMIQEPPKWGSSAVVARGGEMKQVNSTSMRDGSGQRREETSREEERPVSDQYTMYPQMMRPNSQESRAPVINEPPKWGSSAVVARGGEMKQESMSIQDRVKQFSHAINSTSVRDGSGQRREETSREEERPVSDRFMMYPLMMRPNSRESRAPNDVSDRLPMHSSSQDSTRSGVHSAGSFLSLGERWSREEACVWVRGIVAGEQAGQHSRDPKKFIIWTLKGTATVTPLVYEKVQPLVKVGDYVQVELRSSNDSPVFDVEEMRQSEWKPDGHKTQIHEGNLLITCDVRCVKYVAGYNKNWWFMEDKYLGLIGVEAVRGEEGGGIEVGKTHTVTLAHRPVGVSLELEKAGVTWVAVPPPPEEKPFDGFYVGVVTAIAAGRVFIASPALEEDAVLCQNHEKDVLGLWIQFKLLPEVEGVSERRIDPHEFSVIEKLYQTRVVKGFCPELRLSLSYEGEEDAGRKMLRCEMGSVRDCDGLLPTDAPGRYTSWVARYQMKNHVSRWRIAREDSCVEKEEERRVEVARSRSPSPTTLKHRAIDAWEERERRVAKEKKEEEQKKMEEEKKKMEEEEERQRAEEEKKKKDKVEERQRAVETKNLEKELRELMILEILENDEFREELKDHDRDAYNKMFDALFAD